MPRKKKRKTLDVKEGKTLCEQCQCDKCLERRKNAIVMEKADDLVLEYQVDDFNNLKNNYPIGERFESPMLNNLHQLWIFPNGQTGGNGHLSVYVTPGGMGKELHGLQFYIKNWL